MMKKLWRLIKMAIITIVVMTLLLAASFLPDLLYYMPRAKPPVTVVDLHSFLAWKPDPKRAWKITVSNEVYYQLSGPPGRWLASGPAAYAFDSSGRFIGWTADSGDISRPVIIYAPGANRQSINVDTVRALLKTNSVTGRTP
ncbi:MAG TPA: hypothetical protein VFV96_16270 [Verrucomicrobiae bacterium]|nr:hypothetical protein [Verrucomicrobiae bacterium]